MKSDTDRGRRSVLWDLLIALALGMGFLLLYGRTLCPTVYLGDSGQISTAIFTGGIIHPPGYPLFSLLGRAALVLVPSGEPAWRIGCVVALASGLAVVTLYLVARELNCSRWTSAAGAAMFGSSYTFWSQSVRVEVYSLHVLLCCLALLACLCYRRSGLPHYLAFAVLAGSLGLAHHLTIVLVGPGLLALCGPRLASNLRQAPRLLALIGLSMVGPTLYLLLLVWSRAEPLQSWGRPITLSLLWVHASARVFQGILQMPDGPHLTWALVQLRSLLADNFPHGTFVLPVVGAGVLWRRDRRAAAGLLLIPLVVTSYNLCYRIGDIAPYYLPVWAVGAALLAVALEGLRGAAPRPWGRPAVTGLISVALVGAALLRNWSACDLSRATWVREFTRHKLENAPPGSVLITQGDHDTFPIWYLHDVLRVRPDVIPVDRAMLSGTWRDYHKDPSLWYLYRLRRQGIPVPLDVPADAAARDYLGSDGYLIERLQHELSGRPLCLTFGTTNAPPSKDGRYFFRWVWARYHVLPHGILLRLQPKGQAVDLAQLLRTNERLWDAISLPDVRGIRTDQDLDPTYVVDHYACMLVNYGGLYEMAGDRPRAEALYRRAASWAPHYAPAREALASLRRTVALKGED